MKEDYVNHLLNLPYLQHMGQRANVLMFAKVERRVEAH